PWRDLSALVDEDPARFLAAIPDLKAELNRMAEDRANLPKPDAPPRSSAKTLPKYKFSPVVTWTAADTRRITVVPPGHWLLVQDDARFRARLVFDNHSPVQNVESIHVRDGQIACFPPGLPPGEARL